MKRSLRSRAIQEDPAPDAFAKLRQGVAGAVRGSVGFFQAAAAGGFAATIMFPVDMAKTRMQACAQTEVAVAAAERTYTGTLQTISKVFSTEGAASLYRGLGPVLIGAAPEMAVQITAYEVARGFLTKDGGDPKDLKIQFAAGFFSGFSHVLASNPMEVNSVAATEFFLAAVFPADGCLFAPVARQADTYSEEDLLACRCSKCEGRSWAQLEGAWWEPSRKSV